MKNSNTNILYLFPVLFYSGGIQTTTKKKNETLYANKIAKKANIPFPTSIIQNRNDAHEYAVCTGDKPIESNLTDTCVKFFSLLVVFVGSFSSFCCIFMMRCFFTCTKQSISVMRIWFEKAMTTPALCCELMCEPQSDVNSGKPRQRRVAARKKKKPSPKIWSLKKVCLRRFVPMRKRM